MVSVYLAGVDRVGLFQTRIICKSIGSANLKPVSHVNAMGQNGGRVKITRVGWYEFCYTTGCNLRNDVTEGECIQPVIVMMI